MEPKGQSADPPPSLHVPLISKLLLAAALAGVLFLAGVLIRYSHAQADDYGRGGRVRRYGLWGAMVQERSTIGGRWAGSGATYLPSALFDLADPLPYRLTLTALAVLLAASVQAFLAALLRRPFFSPLVTTLSLSLLCLYWTGMKLPGETFCWLSPSGESNGAMALALLVAAGLLRAGSLTKRGRIVLGAVLALATLTQTAMHDLYGAVFCMIVVCGAAVAFWKKVPTRWDWGAVAAAAIVGFLIVATAPGNSVREQMFREGGKKVWDVAWTFHYLCGRGGILWELLPAWLGDVRLWGASALVVLLTRADVIPTAWAREGRLNWRLWIPAFGGAALFLLLVAPPFLTGSSTPFRTFNVTYFVFLLGWFLLAVALSAGRPARPPDPDPPRGQDRRPGARGKPMRAAAGQAHPAARTAVIALVALWPASLLLTGNAPKAFADWTQKEKHMSFPPRDSAEGRSLGELIQRVYEAQLGAVASPGDEARAQAEQLQATLHSRLAQLYQGSQKLGILEIFDEQMRWRDECIRSQIAAGNKRVGVLALLAPFPKMYVSLDVGDISDKPWRWLGPEAYWVNQEVAQFYGLESIGAVSP